MLASISPDAGVITVIGTAVDDTIVISSATPGTTDISINAGQPGQILSRFQNSDITEVVVYAGDGNDNIFSTSRVPTRLFGENGDDTLNGGYSNDEIFGSEGNDRIIGKSGDDLLDGGDGDDIIIGGNGDDVLHGGGQSDRLMGNSGDDEIHGDQDADFIYGGNGFDRLYGGDALDHIYGNGGDDQVYGGLGNDRILGGDGHDQLFGETGNDKLYGGNGNDYLNGGTQADFLLGNGGTDIFSADTLDNFADIASPLDRFENLTDGTNTSSHVYADGTIDFYGTDSADVIRIYYNRITVNGVATFLDVQSAPVVRVFALGGNDDVRGLYQTGPKFHLYGGNGNDYLLGGAGADTLEGGAGNDRLYGRVGADTYTFAGSTDLGFDIVDDTHSVNTLDFARLHFSSGVSVDTSKQTLQKVANTGDGGKLDLLLYTTSNSPDIFGRIEGSRYDDTLAGDFRHAAGGLGSDTYRPHDGNHNTTREIIENAGEGFDVIDHSLYSGGTVIDLNRTGLSGSALEHVIGTNFDDTITNNAFTQLIDGSDGDDLYKFSFASNNVNPIQISETAANGIDTVDYSQSTAGVSIDLQQLPHVENLTGSDFDDQLIGNAADNHIQGGDGNDFIEGRQGIDILEGQSGTDTYNVIPGEELEVTDIVVDDDPSVFLPETDDDGDGLLPSEEIVAGTNPNQFDSDGDLLGDGFENDSETLDPNSFNDPHGDSDGDGLTELEEQIYATDPDNADTDGDGTSDFDEIEQGGDPTDPGDEGEPLADEDIVNLDLTVGDHSSSHSERYDFVVGRIKHQAPEFGVVETDTYIFERGHTHDIRVIHRGTKLTGGPDYDYTAAIGLTEANQGLAIIEDAEDILRVDGTSHTFYAQGKVAKIHLPKVDLDVLYPDGSAVAEEDETNVAKTGFIFPRSDDQSIGSELTELKLEKVLSGLSGSSIIVFNTAKLRVWKDRQRSEEVINGSTQFDIDQVHSLFVESLVGGEDYHNLQIRAVFRPSNLPANTEVLGDKTEDVVLLRAIKSDLDISLHNEPVLSETEEDDPGLTIDLGADKDELAKLYLRSLIPDELNYIGDFFTLNFDSTILKLWNQIPGEVGLDALEEVTAETQFDESEKFHSVWVEGFEVGATTISMVWHSNQNGDDTPIVFDSVKVMTEGLRDVDILLAIDGTGSGAWLDGGAPQSPGGTGMTVEGNRWLSHLRNWQDQNVEFHYGDGPEDPTPIYRHGPAMLAFAQDAPTIIQEAYEAVSEAYWNAVASGAEPKVDILGMSRGGLIASEVAWLIQRNGYHRAGTTQANPYDLSIRFLGLYDPVDQTETVDETRAIPSIVEFSAAAYATNFRGNDPEEISRSYWDRISYAGVSVTNAFSATHSAIQGAPTYSTDPGTQAAIAAQGLTGINGVQDNPIAWLEGYSDAKDVAGSIAIDMWFRGLAISQGVPIELVDDYFLDCLHPDPNPESPNHHDGYCPNE